MTDWRNTGRLTGGDMGFILGVLIGASVAVLLMLGGVLWLARVMVGG